MFIVLLSSILQFFNFNKFTPEIKNKINMTFTIIIAFEVNALFINTRLSLSIATDQLLTSTDKLRWRTRLGLGTGFVTCKSVQELICRAFRMASMKCLGTFTL